MKLTDPAIQAADEVLDYLITQVVATGSGSPLRDRYIGFYAVTAVTHAETLVKEVTLDFCKSQNRYLHSLMERELSRFNARISYEELRKLLARFDRSHEDRFKQITQRLNRFVLRTPTMGFDIIQSYQSLLELRHAFVHNLHANFSQVSVSDLQNYGLSLKRIVGIYARALA